MRRIAEPTASARRRTTSGARPGMPPARAGRASTRLRPRPPPPPAARTPRRPTRRGSAPRSRLHARCASPSGSAIPTRRRRPTQSRHPRRRTRRRGRMRSDQDPRAAGPRRSCRPARRNEASIRPPVSQTAIALPSSSVATRGVNPSPCEIGCTAPKGRVRGLKDDTTRRLSPVATTIALPRSSTATSGSNPPLTRSCAGPKLPPFGRKAACTWCCRRALRASTRARRSRRPRAAAGRRSPRSRPPRAPPGKARSRRPWAGKRRARARPARAGRPAKPRSWSRPRCALSRSSNTTCGLLESSPGAESVSTGPHGPPAGRNRAWTSSAPFFAGGPHGGRVAALVGGDLRLGGGDPLG